MSNRNTLVKRSVVYAKRNCLQKKAPPLKPLWTNFRAMKSLPKNLNRIADSTFAVTRILRNKFTELRLNEQWTSSTTNDYVHFFMNERCTDTLCHIFFALQRFFYDLSLPSSLIHVIEATIERHSQRKSKSEFNKIRHNGLLIGIVMGGKCSIVKKCRIIKMQVRLPLM